MGVEEAPVGGGSDWQWKPVTLNQGTSVLLPERLIFPVVPYTAVRYQTNALSDLWSLEIYYKTRSTVRYCRQSPECRSANRFHHLSSVSECWQGSSPSNIPLIITLIITLSQQTRPEPPHPRTTPHTWEVIKFRSTM